MIERSRFEDIYNMDDECDWVWQVRQVSTQFFWPTTNLRGMFDLLRPTTSFWCLLKTVFESRPKRTRDKATTRDPTVQSDCVCQRFEDVSESDTHPKCKRWRDQLVNIDDVCLQARVLPLCLDQGRRVHPWWDTIMLIAKNHDFRPLTGFFV